MSVLSPADIEAKLLQTVHAEGSIADSDEFGKSIGITEHNVVVGVIKSLESYDMILTEVCAIFQKTSSHVYYSIFSLSHHLFTFLNRTFPILDGISPTRHVATSA